MNQLGTQTPPSIKRNPAHVHPARLPLNIEEFASVELQSANIHFKQGA
jgi:hypothetical protein